MSDDYYNLPLTPWTCFLGQFEELLKTNGLSWYGFLPGLVHVFRAFLEHGADADARFPRYTAGAFHDGDYSLYKPEDLVRWIFRFGRPSKPHTGPTEEENLLRLLEACRQRQRGDKLLAEQRRMHEGDVNAWILRCRERRKWLKSHEDNQVQLILRYLK